MLLLLVRLKFDLLVTEVFRVDGLIDEMFVQVSVVQISRPVRKPGRTWLHAFQKMQITESFCRMKCFEFLETIIVIKIVCCLYF